MEQNCVTSVTNLNEVERQVFDAETAINNALNKVPYDEAAIQKEIDAFNEVAKVYAQEAMSALFIECRSQEKPVEAIIRAYSYDIYALTVKRGVVSGVSDRITGVTVTKKPKQIDLLAFCKFASINAPWQYTISKLNQLLCLRTAQELGISHKSIASTYYLREKAKEIDLGKTPTSNTQLCKILQAVFDSILPEVNDPEKPAYKVNNHDVAYLLDAYTKKSNRARITISVTKDSSLRRLMVDVAFRVLTGSKYGIDGFRKAKA